MSAFTDWLKRRDVERILLIELVVRSSGSEVTRYLANKIFKTGASDTPAKKIYLPILTEEPFVERSMSEAFTGQSFAAQGAFTLSRAVDYVDLDAWRNDLPLRLVCYLGSPDWTRSQFGQINAFDTEDWTVTPNGSLRLVVKDLMSKIAAHSNPNIITEGNSIGDLVPVCAGHVSMLSSQVNDLDVDDLAPQDLYKKYAKSIRKGKKLKRNKRAKLEDSVNHIYRFNDDTMAVIWVRDEAGKTLVAGGTDYSETALYMDRGRLQMSAKRSGAFYASLKCGQNATGQWLGLPGNIVKYLLTRSSPVFQVQVIAASGTSVTLDPEIASSVDDFYNTLTMTIVTGLGSAESKTINDYVGSTTTCTIASAWTNTPKPGDYVEINIAFAVGPLVDADIEPGTIEALNESASYTMGVANVEDDLRGAIDQLIGASLGGYWGENRNNKLELGILNNPPVPISVQLHTGADAISRGYEANSIGNWGSFGLGGSNKFDVHTGADDHTQGEYGFHMNASPTPTADARAWLDLTTEYSLVNGVEYEIKFDIKHKGSDGAWRVGLGSTNSTIVHDITGDITSNDWQTYRHLITFDSTARYLIVREFNTLNDGAVMMDNLSIMKSTLPAEYHTGADAAAIGTEANSVGNFGSASLTTPNVFQSQTGQVTNGTYALEADANGSPSSAARFYLDLDTEYSLIDGRTYTISFDVKHKGTGTAWAIGLGSANTTINKALTSDISSAAWVSYKSNFVHNTQSKFLIAKISNGISGGIYFDNLSIRLLTAEHELFIEADATALWTEANSIGNWGSSFVPQSGNSFASVATNSPPKGTYCLKGDSNGTAVADARINIDLDTRFHLVDGVRYTIDFWMANLYDSAGKEWSAGLSAAGTVLDTDITGAIDANDWVKYSHEFVHGVNTKWFVVREVNATNNGGVLIDGVSIKETKTIRRLLFSDGDIIQGSLKIRPDNNLVWRLMLKWRKYYSTIKQSFDASLTEEEGDDLRSTYRSNLPTLDHAIRNDYGSRANNIEIETLIWEKSHAEIEQIRRWGILSEPHSIHEFVTRIPPFQINIGDLINLQNTKYGLEDGKDLIVVGIKDFYTLNRARVRAWGPT